MSRKLTVSIPAVNPENLRNHSAGVGMTDELLTQFCQARYGRNSGTTRCQMQEITDGEVSWRSSKNARRHSERGCGSPPPNRCPIKFQIARLPIDIGAATQKDLGMFRWQLLDQVNLGGVKYYVRQVARSPKDQTGRVDPFKHQYALTVLLEGDAGLALNFRGNEHVPPSSHTDLWPDNCTDSRLLGLNLSAAGPSPTRCNREISECGRGA